MPNDVKDDLQKWGVPFWKELIAVLKPHMVLMSVAKRYRSDLGELPWEPFSPLGAATRPKQKMEIAPFEGTHIVWGMAQVKPFLHLKYEQRYAVAQAILARPEFRPAAIMAPGILDANAPEMGELR